jgi:hypothetical protein
MAYVDGKVVDDGTIKVKAEPVDPSEERKKKSKPHVVFNITADVWDDGVISGIMTEKRKMGRKMTKYIYDSASDFIAAARCLSQSQTNTFEDLAHSIEKGWETEDKDGSEVIGKVTVDIYSDGYVTSDTAELVSGTRGPKKSWRLIPKDFVDSMESFIGSGADSIKKLPSGD